MFITGRKTMIQIKQYVKAASLDEAYELNQKKSCGEC